MSPTLDMPNLSPNQDRVIFFMIKHKNNELSPTTHQKVSDLIASCKACQKLYKEVCEFFDDSEAFLFEITHKEEVKSARNQIRRLIKNAGNTIPVTPVYHPEEEAVELLEDGCFFCGS